MMFGYAALFQAFCKAGRTGFCEGKQAAKSR
jgi:hypothetical protein